MTFSAESVGPEAKLLLACARTRLGGSHQKYIADLLAGPVNWANLIALATEQSVQPLLLQHLLGEFAGMLPQHVTLLFEQASRVQINRSLVLARQLMELTKAFESAEVLAVPYKGPALASLAYRNFALRSSTDLDFIVPHEELRRAFDVLIGAGYRSSLDPTVKRDAYFLAHGKPGQCCFFPSAGSAMVELHTERTMRYFPVSVPWINLRQRLGKVSIGRDQVQSFSVEDNLIFLAVHGAKHFWDRLGWICDISELIQIQGVDWDLAEQLASDVGCRRMWLLGLSLAEEILGAPLPPVVWEMIRKDPRISGLRRQITEHLFDPTTAFRSESQRLLFRLNSYETLLQGFRQCVRTVTWATEEDLRTYPLPEWAMPFYAALRPWRLLRSHKAQFRSRS